MDFQDLIRALLAHPAENQASLARALGVSQPTVSRWLAKDAQQPTIPLYLAARELAERRGILPPDPGVLRVPLISWVQAGAMVTPDAVGEIADAETVAAAGLDPTGTWIALRVDGTSMDRVSPPDSIVFANLRERRRVPNACYIIRDEETGRATYKRFRPQPDRWEPVSTHDHPTIFPDPDGGGPMVIGRVRRSMIEM